MFGSVDGWSIGARKARLRQRLTFDGDRSPYDDIIAFDATPLHGNRDLNSSVRNMAPSFAVIYYSSILPSLSLGRKRNTVHSMMPTTQHSLPLHFSTPKHVTISSSARKHRRLIIVISTFILSFLTLCVLSPYTPSLNSVRLPLTTSRRPVIPSLITNDSQFYPFEPSSPLSSLGSEADRVYKFGSFSPVEYRDSLEGFIQEVFPSRLQSRLKGQLHQYLDESSKALPARPNVIWQTYDIYPETAEVRSWQKENPEYDYRFLYDDDVEAWVKRNLGGSPIEKMWNTFPHIILKSDLLRYLLLYIEGGIYSDIDTVCLKPISVWGTEPDFRGPVKGGDVASVIVGIEADVGDRQDWHDWWARPLQISQWTLASSPGHPIFLDVIQRVYRKTMELQRVSSEPLEKMPEEQLLPMVLDWTGPGIFTDGTLRFLQIQGGLQWIDLRNLEKPLRAGAVTILPVTGFSPQVGNFGSKPIGDPQAMVQHKFKGSWKPKEQVWR